MPLMQRAFQGAVDWPDMRAVVQAQPSDHLHLIDLPYRLCSWAFDDPANCSLWQDAAGHVLAWAVLQSPFWSLDYAIHPAAPASLLQEVLRWADHRAEEHHNTPFARPMWFINGFKGHRHAPVMKRVDFTRKQLLARIRGRKCCSVAMRYTFPSDDLYREDFRYGR